MRRDSQEDPRRRTVRSTGIALLAKSEQQGRAQYRAPYRLWRNGSRRQGIRAGGPNRNASNATLRMLGRTLSHDKRVSIRVAVDLKTNTTMADVDAMSHFLQDEVFGAMKEIGI